MSRSCNSYRIIWLELREVNYVFLFLLPILLVDVNAVRIIEHNFENIFLYEFPVLNSNLRGLHILDNLLGYTDIKERRFSFVQDLSKNQSGKPLHLTGLDLKHQCVHVLHGHQLIWMGAVTYYISPVLAAAWEMYSFSQCEYLIAG